MTDLFSIFHEREKLPEFLKLRGLLCIGNLEE